MRRVLIVVLAVWPAGSAAGQTVTVVAASSNATVTVAAPGGGNYSLTITATPASNRTFSEDGPVISAGGQVVFTARVAGAGGGSGLFRSAAAAGAVSRLALEGAEASPAIGDYGELRRGGSELAVNAAGQVALLNDTSNFTALIRFPGGGGGPTLVVEDGTAAPGGGAAGNYAGVNGNPTRLNASGQVAFSASVDGSAGDGLFRAGGGTPVALALNGAAAPGGDAFEGFNGLSRLSDGGRVAFSATAGGRDGIYHSNGTTVGLVARVGGAAPVALGGNYDSFTLPGGAPAVNASGQIAFKVTTDASRSAVLRHPATGSATVVLAADGDAAPGTGGGTFGSFGPVMGLNAAGRAAFMGEASGGTTTRGFFTTDGTTTAAVVVGGLAAPGLTGVTFGSAGSSAANLPEEALRLNDLGGVAFWARLTGTGVTTANDSSLWYGTNTADLILLAREGQQITVGPGDIRVLAQLPETFDLSDAGLAFLATFSDGSQGILFVSLVPVPEPGAVLAVAAAGLLTVVRRRRRSFIPIRQRDEPCAVRVVAGSR